MVVIDSIIVFDLCLKRYIKKSVPVWLKNAMAIITHMGDGPLWAIIYSILFLIHSQGTNKLALQLVEGEGIGLLTLIPLRYLIKRERPAVTYTYNLLKWNNYSFPSLHSLRAFFLAVTFGSANRVVLTLCLMIAFIIGTSRVLLLKHFFTDVAVGAIIGITIGLYLLEL
ncbi:MAG: phosphatase PAP2 family protein [Nitrospirae bacterium]|nr:phosphatase PAP2 family protein [Nitrospirota bacterium]